MRLPADSALAGAVTSGATALERLADECADGPLRDAWDHTATLLEQAHARVDEALGEVLEVGSQHERVRASRGVRKAYGDLLFQSQQLFVQHRETAVPQRCLHLRSSSTAS